MLKGNTDVKREDKERLVELTDEIFEILCEYPTFNKDSSQDLITNLIRTRVLAEELSLAIDSLKS